METLDWSHVAQTLIGALVGFIAWAMQRWLNIKMTEETRKAATWAMEQGVAYAQQKYLHDHGAGSTKRSEALTVAQSLAPKALDRLDREQKIVLVESTYAKMRASLPHPTTYSGGEGSGGTPLPPPSKVPRPS